MTDKPNSDMESILSRISGPTDLKLISADSLDDLSAEIRRKIIDTVSQTGGHLASNLGVVELTIAAMRALDLPADKLIFDVGHQCYAYKLLTGRQSDFEHLRAEGGVSGFPKMSESRFDAFGTGHASTSISAAVGYAKARNLIGGSNKVVAIIGDGALTGGVSYEALNDAGQMKGQLLVILNDNQMSIAQNVGGLHEHLTRLRVSRRWYSAKRVVKGGLDSIPYIGKSLAALFEYAKRKLRQFIVDGSYFESLGFKYLGPIDGHDIQNLTSVMRSALHLGSPTVLHVITQKGRGLKEAELAPEKYHGVLANAANSTKLKRDESRANEPPGLAAPCAPLLGDSPYVCVPCAGEAGGALLELAKKHGDVVAITAAMPSGTGLSALRDNLPSQFFDVGIAESHAVVMAAGMAAAGLHPYVALYSTFLQRSIDYIIHDVAIQNLAVTFLVDHAGFVSHDGATHQGLFDIALLQSIPNITILAPSDIAELSSMISFSYGYGAPLIIRYPKALAAKISDDTPTNPLAWRTLRAGGDITILSHGASMALSIETAELLKARGVDAELIRASSIKPIDMDTIKRLASSNKPIYIIEETPRLSGLASAVNDALIRLNAKPATGFGLITDFPDMYEARTFVLQYGLNTMNIVQRIAGEASSGGR